MSRARREEGFTLVEALIAGVVLVVGLLATLTVFNGSRNQEASAERDQTAVALASSELESARSLGYSGIGMSAAPPTSGEGAVLDRVIGSQFRIRADVDGDGEQNIENMILGGSLPPVSTGVQVGGEGFSVYRFVTWRDEECPLLELDPLGGGLNNAFELLDTRQEGLLGALDGVSNWPLLNNILVGATLRALVNPLLGGIDSRIVDVLDQNIDPAIDSLQGVLENGVDLCDVDLAAIEDLAEEMEALQAAVTTLNVALNNLDSALDGILTLNVVGVVTSLTNLINGTINGLVNTAENALDHNTATATDDLLTAIQSTQATVESLAVDTDQNTKRITIAVVPEDDRAGVGPFQPVWTSTVVTDPDEGLG